MSGYFRSVGVTMQNERINTILDLLQTVIELLDQVEYQLGCLEQELEAD